jgi:hypothetical protein
VTLNDISGLMRGGVNLSQKIRVDQVFPAAQPVALMSHFQAHDILIDHFRTLPTLDAELQKT